MTHITKRTQLTARLFDPARGGFDPVRRQPQCTEDNPSGDRHIDKTRQDRLPVDDRPRVRAWRARQGR